MVTLPFPTRGSLAERFAGLILLSLILLVSAWLVDSGSLFFTASGDDPAISWGEAHIIDDTGEYTDVTVGDAGANGSMDVVGALGAGGLNLFYNEEGWPHTGVDEDEYSYGKIVFAPKSTGAAPSLLAGSDNGNTGIHGWLFDGKWTAAHPEFEVGSQSISVTAGDINGDGNTDIASGYLNDGIKIWLGDGEGGWTDGTSPDTGHTYKAVTLFDMNGDGLADIVASWKDGSTGKGIRIWHSTGSGWRSAASPITSGEYADIEVGDLEGDGDLDIVAAHRVSNRGIHFFRNDSDSGGSWHYDDISGNPTNTGYYQDVAFRDLNHDGLMDVAGAVNVAGGGLHVFLSLEGGGWSDDFAPDDDGDKYNAVGLADLNGDGNPDVVAASGSGLAWFPSTLPAIDSWSYPASVFARLDNYDIGFSVRSPLVSPGNYSGISSAAVTMNAPGFTIVLEWDNAEEPGNESFRIATGEQYLELDPGNCSAAAPGDDLFTIVFSFNATWDVPDSTVNMLEFRVEDAEGQSSVVGVDEVGIRFYSGVDVIQFGALDDTLNPGMPMNLSGRLVYRGTGVDIPAAELDRIVLARNETSPDDILTIQGPSNSTFHFSGTAPSTPGTHYFFVGFKLRGEKKEYLNSSSTTVSVDYVRITLLFVDQGSYVFEEQVANTYRYWQRGGESILVGFDGIWASGGNYPGEASIRWGENVSMTSGQSLELTLDTEDVEIIDVVVQDDSAEPDEELNPFGPMLEKTYGWDIKACFDGDMPTITAFSSYNEEPSLRNNSKMAPEDSPVSVLVMESGPMTDLNETGEKAGWGRLELHWNGSLEGSEPMIMEDLGNGSYRCSLMLPLSLAESDDVIFFWITGFDSVGHQLLSLLEPPDLLGRDEGHRAVIRVDPRPPDAPLGVKAIPGDKYVDIIWSPNLESDLKGYVVYKSVEDENHFHPMMETDANTLSVRDIYVVNDQVYYYKVVAMDNALIPNYSNYSATVSAVPEADEDPTILDKIEDFTHLPIYLVIPVMIIPISSIALLAGRKKGKKQGKDGGVQGKKDGKSGVLEVPPSMVAPSIAPSITIPSTGPGLPAGPGQAPGAGGTSIPHGTPTFVPLDGTAPAGASPGPGGASVPVFIPEAQANTTGMSPMSPSGQPVFGSSKSPDFSRPSQSSQLSEIPHSSPAPEFSQHSEGAEDTEEDIVTLTPELRSSASDEGTHATDPDDGKKPVELEKLDDFLDDPDGAEAPMPGKPAEHGVSPDDLIDVVPAKEISPELIMVKANPFHRDDFTSPAIPEPKGTDALKRIKAVRKDRGTTGDPNLTVPVDDLTGDGRPLPTPGFQGEMPHIGRRKAAKLVKCKKCGARVPVKTGAPFCENCGHRILK